jgi:Ca2+/Na+ antiporter
MPKFIQDIVDRVNRLSFGSVLLGFAGSLLMLGVGIAALLVPGGSPILGYFIGSCLVGFVFVFPISAIVLSLKAARTHRCPSAVWLRR